MELKVRKIGNGYGVLLPKLLMEDLAVTEGSILEAESKDGVVQLKPIDVEFSRQLESFLRTESEHRQTYRELAK